MATLQSTAEELVAMVKETYGFKVTKAHGKYKILGPDHRHCTISTNLSHQRELANLRSALARVGWSQRLYEKRKEEDHKARLDAANAQHSATYGDLLKKAEEAVANMPVAEMPGGVTVAAEVVTPEKALDYLTRNKTDHDGTRRQRRLSTRLITQLALAMKRGEWQFTHQGIAFDTEGYLLDGQHRLEAVMMSEVPIPIAVWRGCDPKTFKVLDAGKRRNLSDMLHIEGEANASLLASTLRIVRLWYNVPQPEWQDTYISPDQLLSTLEDHPAVRDSAIYGSKVTKLGMVPTAGAAGHYLITGAWEDGPVEEFFNDLLDGVGLPTGDPALTLRNYLLGQKGRRTTFQASKRQMKGIFHLSLLLRAWNARCENRTIKGIAWKEPIRIPPPYSPPDK
jgi:hypothetical protein